MVLMAVVGAMRPSWLGFDVPRARALAVVSAHAHAAQVSPPRAGTDEHAHAAAEEGEESPLRLAYCMHMPPFFWYAEGPQCCLSLPNLF